MSPGAPRLAPFLVASAVIHVALLAGAPERLAIGTAPEGTAHSISIELVPAGRPAEREAAPGVAVEQPGAEAERMAAERAAADDPAEPEVARVPTETGPSEPAAQTAAPEDTATAERESPEGGAQAEPAEPPPRERVAEASPQPPAKARPGPDEAEPAGGGAGGEAARAAAAERVRAEIASRLAQHFRYPRLARQRGWEGRVVLAFRVLPDGRLTDIRVAESSGRAILDEAAVDALRRVGRVPELGERAGVAPLALELPVTYRLRSA